MSFNHTPHTWTDGEVVTMGQLNGELRDLSVGLQEPWDSYVPTWSSTGTDQPSLGAGGLTGTFIQIGRTIHFRISLVVGTGTTFGTGQWRFNLPVQAAAGRREFSAVMVQSSTSSTWPGSANTVGGTQAYPQTPGTTAGGPMRVPTATVPFAWASGDQLNIWGTYEAAP